MDIRAQRLAKAGAAGAPLAGLVLLCGLAACVSAPGGAPGGAPAGGAVPLADDGSPALVVISWDGAGDAVVDRLLAEGRLPNLAALRSRGVGAEHSVTSFPSKTAAAHAVLWTGCWADCNGVLSNNVLLWPAAEHSLLERRRGFHSAALSAEPFWVTAAKAGKRVTVLSATQSFPPEPWIESLGAAGLAASVPGDRYRSFSGFEHRIAPTRALSREDFRAAGESWGALAGAGSLEATLEVGDETFHLLAFDSPERPGSGLDSLLVRAGQRAAGARHEARIVARPPDDRDLSAWSPPFPVRRGALQGNTFFRLLRLAADGSDLLLVQRGVSGIEGAAPAEDLAAYRAAYPGFHADPFGPYDRGGFGPQIAAGGDGEAEEVLLELIALDASLLADAVRFAIDRWRPDLLMSYSPATDSAGHSWWPLIDPEAAAHDPVVAERMWRHYGRVFEHQDAWLGAVLGAVEPGTVVAVVSDHGMTSTHRRFYPNRALEAAGLLAWEDDDPRAAVDLSRTRALVTAAGDGFVLRVNTTRRRGGIVPPDRHQEVVGAATAALLAARDPITGDPLVDRVLRPEEVAGSAAADLYLDPAPGYYPDPWRGPALAGEPRRPWGTGEHGFWPQRRSMHAIFYVGLAGAPAPTRRGLVSAVDGPIRHIDVAPTLCALIGVPAPPGSIGDVVVRWDPRSAP